MNAATARWSRRYQVALHGYLAQGPSGNLQPAQGLGRRAVSLGLETLDVANLHEQALTALASKGRSSGTTRHKMTERAKVFFAEVIVPIEATHRVALKAEVRIDQLTRTLRRRKKESLVSAKRQQQALAQREAAEGFLKKCADQHAELLVEAQGLQKHLRQRTREILSVQEDERQKTGRELRNEIAQALLAIDLSLLALKASASANTSGLEKEIANAQRLAGELEKRACG